ncbi:MAG TPA: glycine zipper domain-containing protein [Methylomirabilota bacterium]|nr:glycine zipper domain-containing protein [Methylomirabilota bacterium]
MRKRGGYCNAAITLLTGATLGMVIGCSQPLSTREKGALLGAGVGAGTGAIFGGGKGAAIGGAAGALGGAIIGDQMQRREGDPYYEEQRQREQAEYERQQRELERERRRRDYDDY